MRRPGSRIPTLLLALGVASGPAIGGGPVAAQEPDSVLSVDSLRVTVTRSGSRLEGTPYAVSVVREDALQRATSGASLEEMLHAVPGLQIQNRFNYAVGERLSLRGFGSRAQFGLRGVRVLVDGIPATLPDGQSTLDHLDLGSLGRVEILRGPAAALYGNGGGGAITFHTREPPNDDLRQELRLVGGGNGLLRGESTTSGSSGDWGYLLNVSRLSWDGFRTLPDNDTELYGGADRWNVNARVGHQDVGGGTLRFTANVLDLAAENPGSLPRELLDEGSLQAWGFNVAQGTRKDVRQGQLGVSWSGPVGDGRGEFAGWGILRELSNPIPPSVVEVDRAAWGARALLSTDDGSNGDRWGASGGVELEAQRDDRLNFENDGGERGELTLDQFESVTSLGLFAQLRAKPVDRVTVVGGLRYDRFDFEADDHFQEDGADDSGTRTMDALSPTLGVSIAAGGGTTLYANIATSLGTPTTTELANRPDGSGGFNTELEPTRGVTTETGVRGYAGATLRWEVSGWITELDDELVPFEVPEQPGRTFFRNAGSSRYRGVEGLVQFEGRSGVSGRASYTLTDATFQDYVVEGDDFSGNRVPGVAEHRLAAVLRLSEDFWFGEVRADYSSSVAVDDANDAETDPYTLVELRTGLEAVPLGGIRLSPFLSVRNLFDVDYVSAVAVNAFGGRYFEPGPGRTIVAGVTLAF